MLFFYNNHLAMLVGINRRVERKRNPAAVPSVTTMRSAMTRAMAKTMAKTMAIAPNMANTDMQITSITHAPARVTMAELPRARSIRKRGRRTNSKEQHSKNQCSFHALQHVASTINS